MRNYHDRYVKILGDLPEPNEANEISVLCPFHEDMKNSASINISTGLFYCMACETSYNYLQFKKSHHELHGYPDESAPDKDEVRKAIPEERVRSLHFALLTNQPMIDQLQEVRGVSLDILKEYQIGWDDRTNRVAIPIRDENDVCVNIRLYSFTESGNQKMLSWRAGYGSARLWPLSAFKESYVFLCEGEMDRLVLADRGLNAVTSTGGAKTWKSEWSLQFEDMKVRIVYDTDQAGDEGARKAAGSIAEYANEVKIVRLDLTNPGEDITDYFVSYGYDVDDLRELCKAAPIYRKPIDLKARGDGNGDVVWATLGQTLLPKHRGKQLMVPVIVSARRDERIHYPKETMFTCNQDEGKLCQSCAMLGSGESVIRYENDDTRLLSFIGITDKQSAGQARARAGIPERCRSYESQVTESGTIEEILVTPELDTAKTRDADESALHLIQRAFYIGLGLDYNESYALRAMPVPYHKNNKIVHQVIEAIPARDSIESFEMTDELYDRLMVFQAKPGKVKKKLGWVLRQLQDHVTRVWDRLDLHMAMDLVWHSVLEFEFDGQRLDRGWLETCIVGDTRTGKSEVAKQLLRFYGFGELVSGENTSLAGLVGGAIKYDEAWFVKWGRLPLNDRRMIVIDEVTGMTVEDIAKMSDVRDSGIATITKIETQKAPARRRAIWIGNGRPTSGRHELADYDYGCYALSDLIGMPEDIARFDYAMAAARSEVDSRIVNSSHPILGEMDFTSEDAASLILWAWSRGREHVQFQREAIEACYKHAVEMGEMYDPAVPLVMAENQRVKLARVAAAIAVRVFSSPDGEHLIVTAEHIEVARWFLDRLYQKESFGYRHMSEQRQLHEERRGEGVAEVTALLETRPSLADYLTRTKMITSRKVSIATGVSEEEANSAMLVLSKNYMIDDKGGHGFAVTAALKILAAKISTNEYEVE